MGFLEDERRIRVHEQFDRIIEDGRKHAPRGGRPPPSGSRQGAHGKVTDRIPLSMEALHKKYDGWKPEELVPSPPPPPAWGRLSAASALVPSEPQPQEVRRSLSCLIKPLPYSTPPLVSPLVLPLQVKGKSGRNHPPWILEIHPSPFPPPPPPPSPPPPPRESSCLAPPALIFCQCSP